MVKSFDLFNIKRVRKAYPRGPTRSNLVYEISKSIFCPIDFRISIWISKFLVDFWISNWISGFRVGFLDFVLDFRISCWISGFHVGFPGFVLDFWISRFRVGFLDCEINRDMNFSISSWIFGYDIVNRNT